MNNQKEIVKKEESYKDKDLRKMIIKAFASVIGVFILTVLFVIKPQMVNTITKLYYLLSFISVGIMIILLPFVFRYLYNKNDIKIVKVFDGISDFFSLFIIACVVIQSFFVFGYSRHEVVGNSMYPTLKDGQKIIRKSVSKFENGMIVVANYSDEINIPFYRPSNIVDGELLIKRIIAKENDAFTIEEKEVNGKKIIYLSINGESIAYGDEAKEMLECYLLHGVTYDEALDQYIIMEGYYFLMGDNRSVSADSRILGLFTEDQLFGQAIYYYDSFWKWEKLS